MLQLRPSCECCNLDLSPDSAELLQRPRRPKEKLAKHPASTKRIYKPDGCKKVA